MSHPGETDRHAVAINDEEVSSRYGLRNTLKVSGFATWPYLTKRSNYHGKSPIFLITSKKSIASSQG